MKKLLFLAVIMGGLYTVQAQSDIDAFRYSSNTTLGSSARSMGMGGAIGAVGADPSATLSNPAGLAQYKSNIFNFSLGMGTYKNQANYMDEGNVFSNGYNASIPAINLVFTNRRMKNGQYAKKGWVNHNFAIGINKTADFNRNVSYEGLNTKSSMLDYISEYVQGFSASTLDADDEQLRDGFNYFENMFWYGYLIDTLTDGSYYPNYDKNNAGQFQSGHINSRGGIHELNLSFAANYEHKLYFGFGLNIDQVKYSETNSFREEDNPATTGTWNSFDFDRHLETSGYGFSGRLGLMFRPTDAIRIGASVHSPKLLNLHDSYYDELSVLYDDGSVENMNTIDKQFDYTVVSPLKYSVQAAFILGKRAIISAEIESLDYSTMLIMSNNASFVDVNQSIANKYQNTTNIKIGAEYALNSFRVRGGLAQMGTPFNDETVYARRFGSLGMGLSESTWGFDIAIVKEWSEDEFVPYSSTNDTPYALSNLEKTNIVLTLSAKF